MTTEMMTTVDLGPDGDDGEIVELPQDIARKLVRVVLAVAESDGDVRGLVGTAREVRDEALSYLLAPTLGPGLLSPGAGADGA